MSAPRFGRFQKATALLPLAMLSAAATASLAGVGPTTASADPQPVSALPDGSSVPTQAIEAPASVSRPGVVAPGVEKGNFASAVATASTAGIPAAALAAYQRAETVINAADRSCRISWQLIAAIGRVESDHGRVNGNSLDDEGRAVPGIFGIALDGSDNTQAISDTDAGQYDSDTRWDRAVGPMQFIPSTWSVVGVDGDNDGQRDPQDVDDAALATAVYLCSGADDLSTDAGRRAAVFRYNHSHDYVDLVLSFMDAYLAGDFTSVPNSTTSSAAGYFVPTPEPARTRPTRGDGPGQTGGGSSGGGTVAIGGGSGGGGRGGDGDGDDGGTTTSPPTDAPVNNPDGDNSGTPNLPKPPKPDVTADVEDDVKETVDKITKEAA
ncbi:MAG TPA: lytic transglycosylase domain-containing protein [Nocardioides sp.]|nr:lytic transglycosylase domain-containing protein [Nocardioides sp.]